MQDEMKIKKDDLLLIVKDLTEEKLSNLIDHTKLGPHILKNKCIPFVTRPIGTISLLFASIHAGLKK